jgi:translation initiation factor IF-2
MILVFVEARKNLKNDSEDKEQNSKTEDEEGQTIIPIIIKSDVVGSKEAIEYELNKLQLDGIKFKIVKSETGNISETDAKLALAHNKTLIAG